MKSFRQRVHATVCFLKPLERLAIFDAENSPRLRIERTGNGPASKLKVALAAGRWLALHPGSGSEKKNWPEPHWRQLVGRLMEHSPLNLLLVGGESEGDRLERLVDGLPETRYAVARSLPLAELAQLLALAVGFVGHDSGISHLAAAVGRPGLLLWGETDPEVWRPPSPQFELLTNAVGLGAIPAEEVLDACLRKWG
jgi:heptosyltransferase-2